MTNMYLLRDDIASLDEQQTERLLLALPEWRREVAMRYKHLAGRRESATAYLLLLEALQQQYGINEAPHFVIGPHGKPSLLEFPHIHFNTSHCHKAVICAVGDAPVGVDVERLRAIPPRLGRRVGAETPEAFWRQWTAAEAEAKRTGRGAGAVLAALRGAEEAAGDGGPLQKPGADVCPIPLGPGFAAAVCGEGDFPLRIVTGEELAE